MAPFVRSVMVWFSETLALVSPSKATKFPRTGLVAGRPFATPFIGPQRPNCTPSLRVAPVVSAVPGAKTISLLIPLGGPRNHPVNEAGPLSRKKLAAPPVVDSKEPLFTTGDACAREASADKAKAENAIIADLLREGSFLFTMFFLESVVNIERWAESVRNWVVS